MTNQTNNTTKTQIPIFYSTLTESALISLIEDVIGKVMAQHSQSQSSTLNPDDLLTREEAADTFKVSVATIDNYRRDGLIVPCRLGGSVRFKRGDLQAAFSGNILNPYKSPTKGKRA